MGYKQVRSFDPSKMGTRKGWCLQNVRLGFGIPNGTMPSAKADIVYNRSKGTLHPMSEYPSNCAVPVYLDTASPYDHVICDDRGTLWSDGKRLSSLEGFTVYGWGELCDTVRVVEYTQDPTPPTPSGFLPPKGYWCRGDKDPRIGELCDFYANTFYGYYCKTKAQAHRLLDGNLFGPNCEKWTRQFQHRTGLEADGMVGPITYAKLRQYGFRPSC